MILKWSKMWLWHSWFTFRASHAFVSPTNSTSELSCRRITAPARICLRFTCSTCWVAQQGDASQMKYHSCMKFWMDSNGILYMMCQSCTTTNCARFWFFGTVSLRAQGKERVPHAARDLQHPVAAGSALRYRRKELTNMWSTLCKSYERGRW